MKGRQKEKSRRLRRGGKKIRTRRIEKERQGQIGLIRGEEREREGERGREREREREGEREGGEIRVERGRVREERRLIMGRINVIKGTNVKQSNFFHFQDKNYFSISLADFVKFLTKYLR